MYWIRLLVCLHLSLSLMQYLELAQNLRSQVTTLVYRHGHANGGSTSKWPDTAFVIGYRDGRSKARDRRINVLDTLMNERFTVKLMFRKFCFICRIMTACICQLTPTLLYTSPRGTPCLCRSHMILQPMRLWKKMTPVVKINCMCHVAKSCTIIFEKSVGATCVKWIKLKGGMETMAWHISL